MLVSTKTLKDHHHSIDKKNSNFFIDWMNWWQTGIKKLSWKNYVSVNKLNSKRIESYYVTLISFQFYQGHATKDSVIHIYLPQQTILNKPAVLFLFDAK